MASDSQRAEGTVDVIIAAWNRSDTIERAISSAVTEPEVRKVIVVDDGSTDDTAVLADSIAAVTSRVCVCRLTANRGPSAARNRAIELSTAPWLSILDADDFFLPGRIGKLLAAGANADLIADNILRIEEITNGMTAPQPVFKFGTQPSRLNFEAFVLGNVKKRNSWRRELGFLKPLVRRQFLDRQRLRYEEGLNIGEDYALYARALALGGRFVVIPVCGYVSVMRHDSLSGRHTKQDLERLRDFDLQLEQIALLSDADRQALRLHYRSIDSQAQWLAVIDGFRNRSIARFLAPFVHSPAVSIFLLRELLSEGLRRLQSD